MILTSEPSFITLELINIKKIFKNTSHFCVDKLNISDIFCFLSYKLYAFEKRVSVLVMNKYVQHFHIVCCYMPMLFKGERYSSVVEQSSSLHRTLGLIPDIERSSLCFFHYLLSLNFSIRLGFMLYTWMCTEPPSALY